MKGIKITLAVAASALMFSAPAMAFHSGGVAECEGCHTMHNSLEGVEMTTNGGLTQYNAGVYLLQGNQSENCLNCHESSSGPSSYKVSTTAPTTAAPPKQLTPGGDFSWIKVYGERVGHNINAGAMGYNVDSKLVTSPGGAYPANQFHCSSCHDPHGKYRRNLDGTITTSGKPIGFSGSYGASNDPTAFASAGVFRILGGANYLPKSMASQGALAFTAGPPAAVAPNTYNRSEDTAGQTRVAYGQGMSEWCGNCHGALVENGYTSGMGGFTHPAGNSAKLGATIAGLYNSYKKSGDLTGTSADSYSSLAPYEMGTSDYSQLKPLATTSAAASMVGPTSGNETAMCLSCHRAHASGFTSMLRYDLDNEFMVATDAATGTVTYKNAAQQAAYYHRPESTFAPYQRVYCNKCHAKD
jgi:hypothetical protein